MENSPLINLMTDQLRDLYDAETQLTKALPKLAKAAGDEELAQCFRDHAAQTQEQAHRLEKAFEALGSKPRRKPCEAMKGLIQEGQEVLEAEMDESVQDIALVAAARRVEHYEMAAYDALAAVAKAAKQNELLTLLQETLKEETAADKLLTSIAARLVKDAVRGVEQAPEHASAKPAKSHQGSHTGSHAETHAASDSSSHLSTTTTDHAEIQRWAEERGGKPACVQGTGGKGDVGLLRLEFAGKPHAKDDRLSEISWEEFFEKFEEEGLAMVYQEKTAEGKMSNFNKLVARAEKAKPKTHAAK